MRVLIHATAAKAAKWSANHIAERINALRAAGKRPVLGLPTGSTPLQTYHELIDLHRAHKVSFRDVVTFNMDEYVGLPADHEQSYHRFMWDNFFNHIDIDPANVNILDGMAKDPEVECRRYEDKIAAAGGIDLFLGGVGSDGHIAFNEPYSSLTSRTRIKTLTQETIDANARFFASAADVPRTALTVGVGTILDAREVLILAFGYNKARALMQAIEGPYTHVWTISALQAHKSGIILCDEESASEIKVSTYRYFKDIEHKNIL